MKKPDNKLLQVFKDLHIEMGEVSSNVIEAWFDTHDTALNDLLNWMCSSLSASNFVTMQEQAEFSEIKEPLKGDQLESEIERMNKIYPGIFCIENNLVEIDLLMDKYEMYKVINEEEEFTISQYEKTCHKTTTDLNSGDFIKTELNLKNATEKCHTKTDELDRLHEDLYQQLYTYSKNINDFETSSIFLGNEDLSKPQKILDGLTDFFEIFLNITSEDTLHSSNSFNKTCVSDSFEDDLPHDLSILHNRISNSFENYILLKLEHETLMTVLRQLIKLKREEKTLEKIAFMDSTMESVDSKEQQKIALYEMIRSISNKIANQFVNKPKIHSLNQKLNIQRNKIETLNNIIDRLTELWSFYIIIHNLFYLEQEDINEVKICLKKVFEHISTDLEPCSYRTKKMKTTIANYHAETGGNFNFITSIGKLISGQKQPLSSVIKSMSEFNEELHLAEYTVFVKHFDAHHKITLQIKKDMESLERFLFKGPTNRFLCVPLNISNSIKKLTKMLDSVSNSLQKGFTASSRVKHEKRNKWKTYLRCLWIFFYTDHENLLSVLQEIKDRHVAE